MSIIKLDKKLISKDGGIKYSWKLNDNEVIESVFLKFDKKYFGICFSTQAGCKNKCIFCENSITGFSRNLTEKEIFYQVFNTLKDNLQKIPKESLIDLAFMGVGEPLDNSKNIYKAINIFQKRLSKKFKYEYSISTVGNIPEIKKLAKNFPDVKLQISLNSINHKNRARLMPGSSKTKIRNLINAAKYYQEKCSSQVLLNYLMIKDVNDTEKEAENLAKLIKGTGLGVMVSKLNTTSSNIFLKSAPSNKVDRFKEILKKNNIIVVDFKSLSSDINGGCGQLRYLRQDNVNVYNKIYKTGIDKTWSQSLIPKEIINLFNKINLSKQAKILDVGCGKGRLLKQLKKNGFKNIYGVDISPEAIKKLEPKHVKVADVSIKIPFKNKIFDLVFDMTMLGSINPIKWSKIIEEIYRVLKPGGYFISEMFKNKSYIPDKIIRLGSSNLDNIFGVNKVGYQKITNPYFKLINFSNSKNQTECKYYLFRKND